MEIGYDWEFIEDGVTIEPVSVGFHREDGQELYLINGDVDLDRLMEHRWLNPNVTRYLPIVREGNVWMWDTTHQDFNQVVSLEQMRARIMRFFSSTSSPRLWAYYAAHDHVTLGNLFGSFIQLPLMIPQRSNDVMQESERLGHPLMPNQDPATEHHALYDARFVMVRLAWLREVEKQALAKRFRAWKDGDEDLTSLSW